MLQLMEARATPTKDINQIGSELREKNSLLTLGQAISRLSRFVKDPRIIDELGSIKRERNKLVHHFWRVLDWPFQEQSEIKREYELADHLYKRMTYGEIALLEYIQSNDPRIKIHVGAINLETKKIIMEDGSEASRLKK